MDKRYGVIISGGDAGGIRHSLLRPSRQANSAASARLRWRCGQTDRRAAAKTAGTDPEVMI
jgi:hypothetical protein